MLNWNLVDKFTDIHVKFKSDEQERAKLFALVKLWQHLWHEIRGKFVRVEYFLAGCKW